MAEPDINHALGHLQGTLESIEKKLDESDKSSSASRRLVYAQLSEIREDALATRARTEALETVMKDEVRPVVRLVKDWRSRALGGMAVLGVIGAVILLILGAAKETIIEIGRAVFGR